MFGVKEWWMWIASDYTSGKWLEADPFTLEMSCKSYPPLMKLE